MTFKTSISFKFEDIKSLQNIPVWKHNHSAAVRKCIFSNEIIRKIEENDQVMEILEEIGRDMNLWEIDQQLDELVLRYKNFQKIALAKEMKV